jgi:hypothetical protein
MIKCPCLQYNGYPTFFYKITDTGLVINKKKFKRLNTTAITTLIDIAKGNLGKLSTYPVIVFIEKDRGIYMTHRVRLQVPRKREIMIDSQNTGGDASTKRK